MAANGAQYGVATVHFYWIGAIPAMLFLGLVMMPFYYGAKIRSVPEWLRRRYGRAAHLFNAISFALATVLISGVNLSRWVSCSRSCWAGRSAPRSSWRRRSCSPTSRSAG